MKATTKSRPRGLYGNAGCTRAADPTPEEIRKRCQEIRRGCLDTPTVSQLKAAWIRRRRRALAALHDNGAMTVSSLAIAMNISIGPATTVLSEMVGAGDIVEVSNKRYGIYVLVEHHQENVMPEIEVPTNEVVFQRVTRRRSCVA